MELKRIAIYGGGDWSDASTDLLLIPEDINIKEEKKKYREWYDKIYRAEDNFDRHITKYIDFPEWLIERCGAVRDTGTEEFYDN